MPKSVRQTLNEWRNLAGIKEAAMPPQQNASAFQNYLNAQALQAATGQRTPSIIPQAAQPRPAPAVTPPKPSAPTATVKTQGQTPPQPAGQTQQQPTAQTGQPRPGSGGGGPTGSGLPSASGAPNTGGRPATPQPQSTPARTFYNAGSTPAAQANRQAAAVARNVQAELATARRDAAAQAKADTEYKKQLQANTDSAEAADGRDKRTIRATPPAAQAPNAQAGVGAMPQAANLIGGSAAKRNLPAQQQELDRINREEQMIAAQQRDTAAKYELQRKQQEAQATRQQIEKNFAQVQADFAAAQNSGDVAAMEKLQPLLTRATRDREEAQRGMLRANYDKWAYENPIKDIAFQTLNPAAGTLLGAEAARNAYNQGDIPGAIAAGVLTAAGVAPTGVAARAGRTVGKVDNVPTGGTSPATPPAFNNVDASPPTLQPRGTAPERVEPTGDINSISGPTTSEPSFITPIPKIADNDPQLGDLSSASTLPEPDLRTGVRTTSGDPNTPVGTSTETSTTAPQQSQVSSGQSPTSTTSSTPNFQATTEWEPGSGQNIPSFSNQTISPAPQALGKSQGDEELARITSNAGVQPVKQTPDTSYPGYASAEYPQGIPTMFPRVQPSQAVPSAETGGSSISRGITQASDARANTGTTGRGVEGGEQQQPAPPPAKTKTDAEADAKAKAEAEAKARSEADAKAKAEAEAKARSEADAKAKAEAEAKARSEADAKAKAEADAKAKAEAEAKARSEADAKAKAEADAKARSEADAKAKAEADAKAKAEAEAKARSEADAKAKAEAEAKPSKSAIATGLAGAAGLGYLGYQASRDNAGQGGTSQTGGGSQPQSYTVQKGDSLSTIASNLKKQGINVSVPDLMAANGIKHADAIQAGFNLKIPPGAAKPVSIYQGGVGTAADTAAKEKSGEYTSRSAEFKRQADIMAQQRNAQRTSSGSTPAQPSSTASPSQPATTPQASTIVPPPPQMTGPGGSFNRMPGASTTPDPRTVPATQPTRSAQPQAATASPPAAKSSQPQSPADRRVDQRVADVTGKVDDSNFPEEKTTGIHGTIQGGKPVGNIYYNDQIVKPGDPLYPEAARELIRSQQSTKQVKEEADELERIRKLAGLGRNPRRKS